jgi:two-component system response regulator YesN
MIADDEVIIRTGLASVINWSEMGIELLAPAASAEEALERIESERPDILLTDIQMNGKNGLQLAEEARLTLPNLEVIILSGYDDFIYAQQAIRQNVSDYLLKTSRPEEIIKTVLKVKQRVEERRTSQSRELAYSREHRNGLLKRCIVDGEKLSAEAESELSSIAEAAGLVGPGKQAIVSSVSAAGWGGLQTEQSLLLFSVDNLLADLLSCIRFVHKNKVIMVTTREGGFGDKRQLRMTMDKMERLLKCQLTVITGKPVTSPEQWHESYATVLEASRYEALLPHKHWDYSDIEHRKGGKAVCTSEEEKELSCRLLDNDLIGLKTWVQRYIQQLLDDTEATPESFEAAVQSVAIAAHRWLDRVLVAIGREREAAGVIEPYQYKPDTRPFDSLFQHLHAVMKLYHHRFAEGKTAHVQRAIAYIEESLGRDFGLQQVAEHVRLHPNHLSELFKKELGMKFVDYVTQRKMERAARILTTSPAKIADIAAMVGYEDVKYFGQMFKKHTGKTPSEYREQGSSDKGQDSE